MPEEYKELVIQDNPDLLRADGKGIEITRAIYLGDSEASRMFQIIVNNNGKCSRAEKRLIELGFTLFKMPDGKPVGFYPREAIWETTEQLEKSFLAKRNKLCNYGSDTDLFIYAPIFDMYNQKAIEDFQIWMAERSKEDDLRFSKVFIFDYYRLYICDNENMIVSVIKLDRDIIHKLCEEAKIVSI